MTLKLYIIRNIIKLYIINCIYYKAFIPLIERKVVTSLKESITSEIIFDNEKCFLTCTHRSTSQNHEQLDSFCSDFNDLQNRINNSKPVCSVIAADFNARCFKWYSDDKNNTASWEIDALATTTGYGQLIKNPT